MRRCRATTAGPVICLTSFCTGALKSGPTHDPTILARERASHLAPGMTARACSASPDYLFDLEPCYGNRTRGPSPYHGVPIGFPARDFCDRPDQRLCFSPVGKGSGQFAPDATSPIPPNRPRRRNLCPTPATPGPICVRFTLPTSRKSLPQQSPAGLPPAATPLSENDPPAPLTSGIDRAIRLSTAVAVLAAAGIAAYVSYWHASAVVRAHGETGITARLEPTTIDGLVYASSLFSRGPWRVA